jgi:hypothetical protein
VRRRGRVGQRHLHQVQAPRVVGVVAHDAEPAVAVGHDLPGGRGTVAPVDAGGPVEHVRLGRLEHGDGHAAEGLVLEAGQPGFGYVGDERAWSGHLAAAGCCSKVTRAGRL